MATDLPSKMTECVHLSPERVAHREWIGGRALTLLSHYWRDDDPVELTAAIGSDWAEVLEGIPQQFIQQACITYQRSNPRRKPTPGAIYELAKAAMPRPKIAPVRPMPKEEQERLAAEQSRINPERAAEAKRIMQEIMGK